jgi:uncharacterized protein YdcH (DUF465 family)
MVTSMATMTKGLKLSELTSMTSAKRSKRIEKFLEAAFVPSAVQIREQDNELDERIKVFEHKHQMSSWEMCDRLNNGQLDESDDICSWLMLLEVRNCTG